MCMRMRLEVMMIIKKIKMKFKMQKLKKNEWRINNKNSESNF